MSDFAIKEGATLPAIESTLTYDDGTAIDLTGTSITFRMRRRSDTALTVNGSAAIISATAGTVRYSWVSADTDTQGEYIAEWVITYPGGGILIAPSAGYNTVHVVESLS